MPFRNRPDELAHRSDSLQRPQPLPGITEAVLFNETRPAEHPQTEVIKEHRRHEASPLKKRRERPAVPEDLPQGQSIKLELAGERARLRRWTGTSDQADSCTGLPAD